MPFSSLQRKMDLPHRAASHNACEYSLVLAFPRKSGPFAVGRIGGKIPGQPVRRDTIPATEPKWNHDGV